MRIGTITILLVSLMVALSVNSLAQGVSDSTFKDATIEIIQSYEPKIRETAKPKWTAERPPVDTQKARLVFEVPQQALSYTYAAMPIRPLSLTKDSLDAEYSDYLKLGLGNLSSKAVGASLSRFSNEKIASHFQFHHHSLKGKRKHQHSSRTDFLASLSNRNAQRPLTADLGLTHQRYGLYGYEQAYLDFPKDSAFTAYSGLELGLRSENLLGGWQGIQDAPSFHFSHYRTRSGRSENQVDLSIPLGYRPLARLEITAELFGSLSNYDGWGNHLVAFRPKAHWKQRSFQAWVGLYPTQGMERGYWLPDLFFQLRPGNRSLSFDLGYQSKILRNSFREMTTLNPYLFEVYKPIQSKVDEAYLGVNFKLGHHLVLGAKGSWSVYDHLPFMVSRGPEGRYFNPLFNSDVSVKAISVTGRYQIGQLFSLGIVQEWLFFSRISTHQPWHIPQVRFQADLSFKPWEALHLSAYLSFLDQLYASDHHRLAPGLDLGLQGEYALGKRFSIWLRLDNIFNSQYERWLDYPQYGFRAIGGLRFRF